MTDTTHLGLPLIEAAQAQKHVTHNEALHMLDALVMLAVMDRDLTAPPGSPAEGDRYIVKPTGTGAFAGKNNQIAHYVDGGWSFYVPHSGWICYVADEGTLVAWNGTTWGDFFATVSSVQNLALLGVGTTADSTNVVSAKLNNTLWLARTVAEGGDGNLRFKLSKESASKTLSVLYQDNFSGRAEIGLCGDDDFHFKVSPDGSAWYEAIKIDRSTGKLSFPVSGGPREVLGAARTYYVRTDGSDSNTGLANSSGGAFLTIQKALSTVANNIDLAGNNVTIQLGNGTYTEALSIGAQWVGTGTVTLSGDTTTPSNVVIQTSSSSAVITLNNGARLSIQGVKLTSTSGVLFTMLGGCIGTISGNMEIGSTSGTHFNIARGSILLVNSGYTISGGASQHWNIINNGLLVPSAVTITLSGTPNFTTAFIRALVCGTCNGANSFTFSGSATGVRYSVTLNGVVNTNGGASTFFPGDSAGSTATGGQYA